MTQSCFCFPLVVIFCCFLVASQAVFVIPFLLIFIVDLVLCKISLYLNLVYYSIVWLLRLLVFFDWFWVQYVSFSLLFRSMGRSGNTVWEKMQEKIKSLSMHRGSKKFQLNLKKSFQYFDCSKNTQYNSSLQLDYRFNCTLLMTFCVFIQTRTRSNLKKCHLYTSTI